MDLRWAFAGILALALVSGCILGQSQTNASKDDSRAQEDQFIKDYLKEQAPKKVVDVATNIENKTLKAKVTTTTTTILLPCPGECCNETGYEKKDCGRWFACVDRRCTDLPCPFD